MFLSNYCLSLLSHRSYLLKPKRSLAGESGQMTPKDDSVIYMEKLIADQFIFNKAMWPGGAKTDTRLKKPKDRRQQDRKKVTTRVKQSLKLRKVIKKETTQMKQRRICSYFTRSSVNCLTNGQLTVIMLDQQKQLKQIQKLLKKKKNKTHGRPSSFNTLRTRCKKKLGHLISLNVKNESSR